MLVCRNNFAYGICSFAVVLRDEVRVDVHDEAHRGMSEALLHGLYIGAESDEQRHLSAPHLVEVESDIAAPLNAFAALRIRVGGFLGKFAELMVD